MGDNKYNDDLKLLLAVSTKFDEHLEKKNLKGINDSIEKFNTVYNKILKDGNSGENKVKILLLLRELTSVMEDIYRKMNKHINRSIPTLILFYNLGCQSSAMFMNVWKDIKILYRNKLNFIEIDATVDKYKKVVKEFNIIEYPSVKFVSQSYDILNYDDILNKHSVQKFLDNVIKYYSPKS
jgi:hypothetical protein